MYPVTLAPVSACAEAGSIVRSMLPANTQAVSLICFVIMFPPIMSDYEMFQIVSIYRNLLRIYYNHYFAIITRGCWPVKEKHMEKTGNFLLPVLYTSYDIILTAFNYFIAIASISNNTSFGSLATSTQLLAGKSEVKNSL